jgi:photosystem II stability/assembly factor-like uncharacterized protein
MGILALVILTACATTQQPRGPEANQGQNLEIGNDGPSHTPRWEPLPRITRASLRGLHAVSEQVVWASGTDGTVLRTRNGSDWELVSVPNAEGIDFRDIHAFDSLNATVMSAGNGVRFYRTQDGGRTWQLEYEQQDSAVFFDGMDFDEDGFGVSFGDPIQGSMQLLQSRNRAASWQPISQALLPTLSDGEAGFAASGTGIVCKDQLVWIATGGGIKSRVFCFDRAFQLQYVTEVPIRSGEGRGIFSMAWAGNDVLVTTGGSYVDSTDHTSNLAISSDNGRTWSNPIGTPPRGYRSCVATDKARQIWYTVGRTGSEWSSDQGASWKPMGDEGYFACCVAGGTGWAVGRNGKMARLSFVSPR